MSDESTTMSQTDRLFFAGLLLMVSPVVTWAFLDAYQILSLMVVGLVGAVSIFSSKDEPERAR